MLLVKREKVTLVSADGEPARNVPEGLRQPLVASKEAVAELHKDYAKYGEVCPIPSRSSTIENEQREAQRFLSPKITLENNQAFWSGYRSALVKEGDSWFRLKGVSVNLKQPHYWGRSADVTRILGGLLWENARYEREFSGKLNDVLRGEGINPVMDYRGTWLYNSYVSGHDNHKRRLCASIIEVKGDTRLDELVQVMVRACDEQAPSENARKAISELLYCIGRSAGYQMKLMHKNDILWGTYDNSSNAHWGNIVVHKEGNEVSVGLVDFDAADGLSTRSRSRRRIAINDEQDLFFNDTNTIHSMRHMKRKYWTYNDGPEWRWYAWSFQRDLEGGFLDGYSSRKKRTIDASLYDETIHELKKHRHNFSEEDEPKPSPVTSGNESKHHLPDNSRREKPAKSL